MLTCAQPSNKLHLGNYLGAISHWVGLQDRYTCFFGIVDLHAMTLPYTPADLRANSLDCAAQYMACGLDPSRCHIFLQSHIQGLTELAWILTCLCPLGQLERMTQFKDLTRPSLLLLHCQRYKPPRKEPVFSLYKIPVLKCPSLTPIPTVRSFCLSLWTVYEKRLEVQ